MQLSIQVKQAMFRLQKQNKSIKELAGTFGVAKSTVWYILRTVVDDLRTLSMVKKKHFTTSSQEKNTLQSR